MNTSMWIVLIIVAVMLFWVLPVLMGIREARRKNRSPNWMWLCIYPLLAWIPYLVIRSLPALKDCPACGEKAKESARICPHCRSPFENTSSLTS